MPLGSGLAAQMGWAKETTKNTFQVPTKFMDFVQESMNHDVPKVQSQGLRNRRLSHKFITGLRTTSGQIAMELQAETMGSLWELAVGPAQSTGTAPGPFTHVFEPGDLASATIQLGKPSTDGTVHPFTYLGCMINQWELAINPGEFARCQFDVVAHNEVLTETLATPTFSPATPLTFAHASMTIDAATQCFDTLTLSGNNNLEVKHSVCTNAPDLPKIREANMREYGGTFTTDFDDLTLYQQFLNGTPAALQVTLNAGASAQLSVAGTVCYNGQTPQVAGPEVLLQTIPFVFTDPDSDAEAFTLTVVNNDETP